MVKIKDKSGRERKESSATNGESATKICYEQSIYLKEHYFRRCLSFYSKSFLILLTAPMENKSRA